LSIGIEPPAVAPLIEAWSAVEAFYVVEGADVSESDGQLRDLINQQFAETHRRLDSLTAQVAVTNGRLRDTALLANTHAAHIESLQRDMSASQRTARTIFGDLKVLILLALGLITGTVAVLQFLGRLQ
jgi:hypothetical protein